MKLGIYMGSFNPPHKGHIKVVNYLLKNKYIDKILIVPTLGYWNKTDLVSIKDRINMLSFFSNDKIIIDKKHNKYIYTCELVREIEKEHPNDELSIIMGADNIINLDKWKNYQELLKYQIIIMNRDNIDVKRNLKNLNGHFIILENYPYINISSTIIRNDLSSKYLDKRVLNYINNNHLYNDYIDKDDKKVLISNISKIHTTRLGKQRIIKNLKLNINDVVEYLKNKILSADCIIYKKGKNYYCEVDNIRITINSYNYCIITAHEKLKDNL